MDGGHGDKYAPCCSCREPLGSSRATRTDTNKGQDYLVFLVTHIRWTSCAELMALFPPAPPNNAVGSTSGFFFEQERAFFARKGKEIVTVQIEVDVQASHSLTCSSICPLASFTRPPAHPLVRSSVRPVIGLPTHGPS